MGELEERFNARFSNETIRKLKELSRKTGISMSEIVRRLVEKAKPQDFNYNEH